MPVGGGRLPGDGHFGAGQKSRLHRSEKGWFRHSHGGRLSVQSRRLGTAEPHDQRHHRQGRIADRLPGARGQWRHPVLIAHGIENTDTGERGVAFEWGGQQYTDFGAGAGQMPVPPGFSSLSNVSVSFCSCYSANDPDGTNGPNTSLTNKILRALGGRTNNTARGFVGQAAAGTSMVYWYPQKIDRLPKKQRDQARMNYDALIDQCLAADSSWQDKPPKNRSSPPPNPNQESCALQILQNCAALSNCLPMHFKIIYTIPTEATTNQHGGGSTGSSCGGASFQVLGLGRPEIDISGGSSGHATLTWTRQPVDFQLEYTADLDPPLTWSMATNPVSESAGVFFAQVDATGLSGYYRLAEAPPSAEAPTVLVPPRALTVAQGQTATFNVQATGTPPLNYQWRRNGAILPGAGGSTYAISNVQPAQAGTYSVFVSNPAGLVESTPAVLTVQPQDQPPFISFIPTFTIPRNSSTGPIPFN